MTHWVIAIPAYHRQVLIRPALDSTLAQDAAGLEGIDRIGMMKVGIILKPNGILLLTTRSRGFEYHGYPFDFWRYEIDDIKILFSELSIEVIEKDPEAPGVFIKASKPVAFRERDLSTHELYSMVRRKRCRNIEEFDILFFRFKRRVRRVLSRSLPARAKASIKDVILEEKKIS